MTITISTEYQNLHLITSGILFAKPNKPFKMTVFIDDEQTVSVLVNIHATPHPEGKSMIRQISDDGTLDEWHIYQSADEDYGFILHSRDT